MKIVCDNCGAKYSIADEKVKGKTFKIRCKKCQESIVVRGTSTPAAAEAPAPAAAPAPAPAGPDAATRVFDYSGMQSSNDPVWYVAVDGGEQQGPYTTAQMREYLAAGNITEDTYVWRDGFDDWKAAREVPEIAGSSQPAAEAEAAAPAAAAAATAAAATDAAAGGGLFDSPPAAEGGLFDSPPASEGGLFDSPPVSEGGDLFGSAATATGGLFDPAMSAPQEAAEQPAGGLFDEGGGDAGLDLFSAADSDGDKGGIFASTDAGASSRIAESAPAMTGQRNENSVLFSLSNLQALAAEAAPSTSPQVAAGEASGLIDIRAMASSLAAEAEKADDVDALLAVGGGFSATAAPVLKPAAPQGMSMGAKLGIAAALVAAVAAIVVTIVVVMNKGGEDEAAKARIAMLEKQLEEMKKSGATTADIEAKLAEIAKMRAQAAGSQPASGQVVTQPESDKPHEAAEAGKQEETPKQRRKTDDEKKSGNDRDKKTTVEEIAKGDDQPTTKKKKGNTAKKKKGNTAALDALLGGGGTTKKTAPAPKPASTGGKLTRDQVKAGMNAVAASVRRCGAGKTGTFRIRARIAPDGRVDQAQAVGDFKGTPAGACAARAVRRARFPRSSSSVTVTYPFRI